MAFITAYTALDMRTFMDWRGTAPTLVSPTQVVQTDGERTSIYLGQFSESDGRITGILTGYQQLHGNTVDVIIADLRQGLPFWLAFDYIASGQGDYVLQLMMIASDMAIAGSSGDDFLLGHGENDAFTGGGGNDTLMGGGGFNKAHYGGSEQFFTITVTAGADFVTVEERGIANATDTLRDIQQLVFSGTVSTIDPSRLIKAATLDEGRFGDLTELYVAYFNRAPDASGLYYWASRLVEGMSMQDIATSFFVQPETQASLPPSLSTQDFVTKVYANVLGRAPDPAGFDYWVHDLDSGTVTRDVFVLALINGAKVPTANPLDAQYLANKADVGMHFALDKGLGDADWARQVMVPVDATLHSVAAANAMTDVFATRAVTTESHLLMPLVGLEHPVADYDGSGTGSVGLIGSISASGSMSLSGSMVGLIGSW